MLPNEYEDFSNDENEYDTDELEALDEDELQESDDSDEPIVPGNLDSLTGREDDVDDLFNLEERGPEGLYRPDD